MRLFIQQNKEIGEFERNKDWNGLLNYAEGKSAGFNDVNWSTTFSRLGRLRQAHSQIVVDPRFGSLMTRLEGKVGEGIFFSRELASIVHALGVMGVKSEAVVLYVEDEVRGGDQRSKAEPHRAANTLSLSRRRQKLF